MHFVGGDTPYALNQRLGHNLSVIQIAQNIPVLPYNWNTGAHSSKRAISQNKRMVVKQVPEEKRLSIK